MKCQITMGSTIKNAQFSSERILLPSTTLMVFPPSDWCIKLKMFFQVAAASEIQKYLVGHLVMINI